MKVLFLLLAALVCVASAVTYNCPSYNPNTRTSTCRGDGATPGPYVPTTSTYRSACHITNLPSTLTSTVNTLFPEGAHPDPALLRPDVYAVFTQSGSNISFTYVSTGAGYTNRMGYAIYDPNTHTAAQGQYVFPKINTNSGYGCLTQGDTYKFGPFASGQIMIFFLDPDSSDSTRYWSYIDSSNPPFRNPDTGTCSPDGCVHSSWAYLTNEDITVFGFEDLSLGDADYNDFMFFMQVEGNATFNEVPEYGGGTIKVCNGDTAVSTSSYAEVNCTQWGLLESTAAQSCLTFMAIPAGWTWASYNDPAAIVAISTLRDQWSYSNANCFLLKLNDTAGAGFHPDGTPCSPDEYTITTFKNGTKICYNAKCTSRFVLRGIDLGVACSSVSRCSSTQSGNILGFAPISSLGVTMFPSQYSVYLKTGTGSVPLTTSLQLPNPLSNANVYQNIDIMVLADLTTMPSAGSTGNPQSNFQTSWNSFASTLTAAKLNATIGFAQYATSSTAPYYILTSSYTLSAQSGSNTIPSLPALPASASSCPTSNRNLLLAAQSVMNNAAINWRRDSAFKVLMILSTCDFDVPSDWRATGIATGIVPIFVYANSGTIPSTWTIPTANQIPLQTTYKATSGSASGKIWLNAFATSGSSTGAGLLATYPPVLLGVPASGQTSFFSSLSSSGTANDGGRVSFNYTLSWPASITDYTQSSYSTVLRLMGRETTSITVNFNHPPVLNDLSFNFVGNVNQTVTFTPSDADGNTLNLIIDRLPTKGKLYNVTDGTQITTTGGSLPRGVYSVLYVPNSRVSGGDYFLVSASDGCASDQANVSLTIIYANTPPVATDFTINMDEDSLPTGQNGYIDFSINNRISDADIAAGQAQTLTVQLVSMPNPTTNGQLTNANTYGAVSVGSIVGKQLRFNLTQPRSGYGTVTFSYQVSDGTTQGNSLSNIATVTIIIRHVNHAPILSMNPTTYKIKQGSPGVALNGIITDYDNDNVQLFATAHNLTSYTVAASNTLQTGTAVPFAFYSTDRTVTNNVYTISGLNWVNTAGNDYEAITFQAQDSTGAWSNSVVVILATVPLSPPTWVKRPINDSYAGPFSMDQNTTLSGLTFEATDTDIGEYATLIFNLVTPPANGIVKLKALTTGSDATAASGTNYGHGVDSVYVGTTSSSSFFYATYIPNPTFFGVDSFTWNVRDATGLYATDVATVTVNVIRANTPPISADSTIQAAENTLAWTTIPALSTNDASGNDVVLVLQSVNFPGQIFLENGTAWVPGASTSAVNSNINNGLLVIGAKSVFGAFTDQNTPTGTFTYKAYEAATGLYSGTYTGTIYVSHVNHPPTSANRADTVKRRVPLQVVLSASDPDADDTPADNVKAYFQSIAVSSKGNFYFDQAMTQPLTAAAFNTPLTDRTFWYVSNDDFSSPQTAALATYTFSVVDSHGLTSTSTYRGSIIVTYAGDVPTFGGSLEVTTYQETPVPMVLAVGVVTESGGDPIIRVTTKPLRGSFATCSDDGTCDEVTSYPTLVTSSTGRVVFIPQNFDWDYRFTTYDFTITDSLSGATGTYTMVINVIHVNKRPNIAAVNFPTTVESSQAIVINESTWRSFDWKVWDVDSLPSTLTTSVRVAFYTSQGFELYACTTSGTWNSTNCAFAPGVDTALADRGDFTRNGKKSIPYFEITQTACPDFTTLKNGLGIVDPGCESHFKMAFAPTTGASFTPYVTITFTAVDDQSAESTSISALIAVKAINTPPTVWAPAIVLAGQGVTNPFLRDTSSDSSTYNNPVSVGDDDSNGNIELLIINVVEGYSGNLIYPDSAPCTADPVVAMQWNCYDRIASFNQWLTDLRFEVTSADRADLKFTMCDLGFTSDYKPSPSLNVSTTTSIRLTAAIAAPKGNNSTLAIAVGVAAGVGLLLLGALGFFLRKAVAPPSDDYFSAATTPLSAAPQSPLYQAQNTEHVSALYKGK